MSTKKARETFKEMLSLCYGEDYPELHRELMSLESITKKSKETYKYEKGMEEIFSAINLFADDFPEEIFADIEKLYNDFLEEEGF